MDKIQKFVTRDLMVRVAVANSTELVQKMSAIQETMPLASIGLGRAVTGTLLMASQMKEGHRIGIYFRGDGPLGGLFAEANYEGEARGYCHNPQADLPLKDGRLDLAGAVGKGVLTVTRNLANLRDPYHGIVPIVSGEIGQDLAYYMYQSHQVLSVVSLAVYLDGDGSVLAAGGVMLELMPGAGEKIVSQLEKLSAQAPSLSKRLVAGDDAAALAAPYVHDELVPVEHPHSIQYTCRCSKERAERTLRLMGRGTLAEMVLKAEDVPITCQFCGQTYTFTPPELRILHDTLDF